MVKIAGKKIRSFRYRPEITSPRWLEAEIDLINEDHLDYFQLEFEVRQQLLEDKSDYDSSIIKLECVGEFEGKEHWKLVLLNKANEAFKDYIKTSYDKFLKDPNFENKSEKMGCFFEENQKNGVKSGNELYEKNKGKILKIR